jgi:catechol 1,2-dioxygenase
MSRNSSNKPQALATTGNPRLKRIVQRVLQDTARLIEDLEVTEDEFWLAVDYLNRLGGRGEAGLLVAGLGIEHFLDLLQDAKDAEAGLTGGTPRTIEGPLYVAGAPLAQAWRAWTMAARRAWPR